MARGLQKQQAQAKGAEKHKKKGPTTQKGQAEKAMKAVCNVCKTTLMDKKQWKEHHLNKHPKVALPDELKD
eukprot:m.172134 g.172134  ORF g.172134 m.172134 type:complete len:71 (+) comp13477_c0_seq1:42-254(+)